jgi:predicted nucleotide-binding protein
MTPEELRAFLTQRQVRFDEKDIQFGTQFRCKSREIFNVYETGRITIGGKQTELSAIIRDWDDSGRAPSGPIQESLREGPPRPKVSGPDRNVFVVYGHDISARDALELLLRRMDLNPIILQKLPAAGDTVIEKLEHYLGEHGNVGFACVLLTPDDEGHRVGTPEEKKYRARQNVILELGMVLGRLGRRRVAILTKESVEQPSDIAGLIYIPFTERVDDARFELLKELLKAGYTPRTEGL